MSHTENPPRVYRYPWRSWLWTLGLGVVVGLMAITVIAIVFDGERVVLYVVIFLTVIYAVDAIEIGLRPRRFVLREHELRIYWLWREESVPTADIRLVDPPAHYRPDSMFALKYGRRTVLIPTSLGGFDGFKTELLLRGARAEPDDPAAVVKVTGKSENTEKVPLMMLLKDRAPMNPTEARDCAVQILNGEKVSVRCRSVFDARALRRELSEMGVRAQNDETA